LSHYDLIIFDCDGTLLDSELAYNECALDLFVDYGVPRYSHGKLCMVEDDHGEWINVSELRALLDAPIDPASALNRAWQAGYDTGYYAKNPAHERAAAQLQGEPSEVIAFGIQVEKLLCEALGREWSASGISIESLVAELKGRPQGEPVAVMNDGREGEPCIWFSRPPNGTKLYAEQPAPVAVDERAEFDAWVVRCGQVVGYSGWREDFEIWMARGALNSTRPTHANPPPGTEPSGTHRCRCGSFCTPFKMPITLSLCGIQIGNWPGDKVTLQAWPVENLLSSLVATDLVAFIAAQ